MRISSFVVIIMSLFNGIAINIMKLPEGLRYLVATNPFFVSISGNLYNFLDHFDCGSNAGLALGDFVVKNGDACRTMVMSSIGYIPYGEHGLGSFLVFCWICFFLCCADRILSRAIEKLPVIFDRRSSAASTGIENK